MSARIGCILFFVLATCCQAQTNLATLKANYESANSNLETTCETQKAEALNAYGKALDSLAVNLQQKGDLDGYLAVTGEKKRFADAKNVAEDSDIRNGDVLLVSRKCRASAAKAEQNKNAKSIALLKTYVVQLESLVKQLVIQDKIEAAKEAREELDKLQFMLADAESKVPAPVAKVVKPVTVPTPPPPKTPPAPKVVKTAIVPAAPPPARQIGNPKTIDLGNGITMVFLPIPAGSFIMGSENSGIQVHKVTITKTFYMTKYEVTQEQWEAVMGSNPSNCKGAKNPVETVSWSDCNEFLSRLKDKIPGVEVRLPTDAEWEYACRSGSSTEFYYGNDELKLVQYAWYMANSDNATHPVGEKKPNAWGLYDMHGNVWEWCSDWVREGGGEVERKDPEGPPSGTARVRRGGSFNNEAGECRSALRIGLGPEDRVSDVGLRVVVVPR